MRRPVVIHKRRTEVKSLSLGFDASEDTITSQIRAEPNSESELIAEWVVTQLTDGTDGEFVLTLDESVIAEITATEGYMDAKRVSAGKSLPVFDQPLKVLFEDVVTV